jgi:hypothetical protein
LEIYIKLVQNSESGECIVACAYTIFVMKKMLLPILLMICVSGCSQIPLGFKAGVNVSKIVMEDVPKGSVEEDYSSVASFHVGIFSKLRLSNKFDFIPELQYIRKGYHYKSTYSEGDIRLDYIELPLLISYTPISLLAIEAGPSAGIKVKESTYIKLYESTDVGVVGGLRFNLTSKWSALARYYYGITSVNDIYFNSGPNQGPVEKVSTYNRNLQFSIAYYLK